MKHSKKISCLGLITVLLLMFCLPSYSQNWQLGGNPNPPMNLGNNFLGSDGTNNIPIRLGTFGITRMFIQNNTGPTAGFVGIGNTIINPNWQLDVNDNVNLNIFYASSPGFGYRINGNKILSNPGTKNIFVGNGAGTGWSSLSPTSYTSCVFVGENAGAVNQGASNTFIGDDAGLNNTTGDWNTFIGSNAGESNTTGRFNTFVGHHAGLKNTTGDGNTYLGYHTVGTNPPTSASFNTVVGFLSAGNLSNNGNQNSLFGARTGNGLVNGVGNCMFGYFTGINTSSGNKNIFMGYASALANITGSDNVNNRA